jgi:hypothetical protein
MFDQGIYFFLSLFFLHLDPKMVFVNMRSSSSNLLRKGAASTNHIQLFNSIQSSAGRVV